mgnify:FL=1
MSLAGEIRKRTEDAGLEVAAYGSYYKVIDSEGKSQSFEPVMESALALGTDSIRIWAGGIPSDSTDSARRSAIMEKLAEDLDMAEKSGIKLGLEFHANMLADSNAATKKLLDAIKHTSLYTYWQPIYWLTDMTYRMDGLEELAPRILNIHVFKWLFSPGAGSWDESTNRRPLAEGSAEWKRYLEVELDPAILHYAPLEFVRGDLSQQVHQDAAVLNKLVHGSI